MVLCAVCIGYALWSKRDLERAKGVRDSLRLEMESGAVKTFAGDIAELKTKLEGTKVRVTNLEANRAR